MFQGQFRILKDHLEAITKLHVGMGHVLIPWLLEWTGATLNRYVVHKNGMTSHQCTTGKKSTRPVATCGEKVLYMPLKTERLNMGKDEPKLKEGLWLGVRLRSDEALIGTANGVVKARTTRRPPKSQRWGAELGNPIVDRHGDPRQVCRLITYRQTPTTLCQREQAKTTQ